MVLSEIYEGDSTFYVVTSYLEGLSLSGELEKAKVLINNYYIDTSLEKTSNIKYKNNNE